jgi:hypothetical protein
LGNASWAIDNKPETTCFGGPHFKLQYTDYVHAPTDTETADTGSAELRIRSWSRNVSKFASLNAWSMNGAEIYAATK